VFVAVFYKEGKDLFADKGEKKRARKREKTEKEEA